MGLDQYKVDVLHYINPHLIWVLVQNEGDEDSFYFEQIGIYGILPQNVTFGGEDCVLKAERCEQWMPAASVAMKRCFLDAVEVWFSPTYIDKKSSIFDDNTHKYGDLKVIKKNGDKVSLFAEILNSDFAYEDERLFHQELKVNNLTTRLNYVTAHEVMKNIQEAYKTRNIPKTKWLEVIKKQTSVLEERKHIESSVTPRSLEVCDRDNVETLLQNKLNVLKLCKDVDEVSMGRACGRRSSLTSGKSSVVNVILKKKLEWLESQRLVNHPIQASKPESLNAENPTRMHADKKTKDIQSEMYPNDDEFEPNNNTVSPKNKNNLTGYEKNDNITKGKKPRQAVDKNTTLVAYGPAGLQANKFTLRPWTAKEEKEEHVTEEKRKPEPETEFDVEKSQDVYANTDSEVNLKISNLEVLKRIRSVSSMQNKPVNNNLEAKGGALNALRRKIKYLEEKQSKITDRSSSVSDRDSSRCDLDSDDESITGLEEKLGLRKIKKDVNLEPQPDTFDSHVKRCNVNPFKNIDGSLSVFVDKLVTPVLMVHTKKNNRIEPVSNMRDIPFGKDIHVVLRNMGVQKPMRPQTISWPTILRGHSFFLVGPYNSGNTMGYLPAVCRLVYDFKNTPEKFGLSCIIVCATSHSVASVEYLCKMFLHSAKILACYVGMNDMHITTSLLNGCDLLICTPSMLVRLIQEEFSLDFRSLSTFVIDDCEHISTTYLNEIKFCLLKLKELVKNRVQKEWKVQYVVISRVWCDFMSSLARKAPDSVVCISAFEECILYSKAATSVEFVAEENKLTTVINFLEGIDKSKKTVIVCRTDAEVKLVENALNKLKYVVFSCDSTMTVQELYNLDKTLKEYEEPVLGPILVCCDGNLTHLNVTDAHYLVHYSLPDLYSTFCKRFAVLIDHYPSIFKGESSNIKIKIIFDINNVEQLPKILQFIKRCTRDVPPFLDEICSNVLTEKYLQKAQDLVPICRRLLTLGKCPDYWNCNERHAIFKEFDSPKSWLPKEGVITFNILHYHSAVNYSARLTSCANKSNVVVKYSQTYSLLTIKMGMYFSKEENRKLHGVPKLGDICAVTLKQNLFVRCQVAKVLGYEKNRPTFLLIKLVDEEKYETARDTSLYYLPDDLKEIETHVVNVILANLMPQDKDVTFSKLAENRLKRITDENDEIDMRGQITMVVGNTIFVDTLEACQNLSSLEEVVVKCDFRKELLDGHAIPNPDHIDNLRNVCDFNNDISKEELERVEVAIPVKELPKGSWAHLESGVFSKVLFIEAENPSRFFVRPEKYDKCLAALVNDIKKYVGENSEPIQNITIGDIVLAEFPDEHPSPERARIDSDIKDNKVKCFFVDQGEWKHVSIQKIYPINEKFIAQLPFQAIECRLVGLQPFGDHWTDFSTNFFIDSCFDSLDKHKQLYIKYFTQEKPECTEGHKYGVVLIDTYSDEDIIINLMLVNRNLADENDEIELLNDLGFERKSEEYSDSDVDDEPNQQICKIDRSFLVNDANKQTQYSPSYLSQKLLRSMPLVDLDSSFDDFELQTDSSGNLCGLPISEIASIKQLPNDSLWTQKVMTSPVFSSGAPSNVNSSANRVKEVASSIDNSKRQSEVASIIDDSKRPSDVASTIDHSKRLSDVASTIAHSKRPSDVVATIDHSKRLSDVASTIDHFKRPSDVVVSPIDNFVCPSEVILSKPKLLWRQNKNAVTVKIKLIVDDYDLIIKERNMKFSANANGTNYGFDFELYGVVNLNKCRHCNKGLYIQVELWKVLATNWLTLTRHNDVNKWILYDVESICVSSDEEPEVIDPRNNCVGNYSDSDSDAISDVHDDELFSKG